MSDISFMAFPLLAGILAAMVIAGGVLWTVRRRQHVSHAAVVRIRRAWKTVETCSDPLRALIEADKVFALLLEEMGQTGTFVERFQPVAWRFRNRESIWWAHKLRNTVAHDTGVPISAADAARAVAALRHGIASVVHL